MLLARLEEDAVAGTNDLDGTAPPLRLADALEDVDRLAVGMLCQCVRAPSVK